MKVTHYKSVRKSANLAVPHTAPDCTVDMDTFQPMATAIVAAMRVEVTAAKVLKMKTLLCLESCMSTKSSLTSKRGKKVSIKMLEGSSDTVTITIMVHRSPRLLSSAEWEWLENPSSTSRTVSKPFCKNEKSCRGCPSFRTIRKSWGLWLIVTLKAWNLKRSTKTEIRRTSKVMMNTQSSGKKRKTQRRWLLFSGTWIRQREKPKMDFSRKKVQRVLTTKPRGILTVKRVGLV